MREFCLILASGIFAIVIFQWTTRRQERSSHWQIINDGELDNIKRSHEVNTPKLTLLSSEVVKDETKTIAFDYDDDDYADDDDNDNESTSSITKTTSIDDDDDDYDDDDDEDDEWKSSSSTTTTTTTIDGGDKYDDDDKSSPPQSFQDEIWPRLKQKLCPDMIPNIPLAKKKLFHLARRRLGLSRDYQHYLSSSQDDDDMYNRFFDFHVAINAYDPKSKRRRNNRIMGYVPIWKCANDQIRFAMKETLGDDNFDHRGEDFTKFFERTLPSLSPHPPCLVTVIRDPISHFLSAYNEIEVRYFRQHNNERKRQLLYDDFGYTRYDAGSTARFVRFVTDVLSHPKVEIKIYPLGVGPIKLPHVYLMSGILSALARYNATLTDYLPSLTNLTTAWPRFVSSACGGGGGGGGVAFPANFATTPLNEMVGRHRSERDERGFRDAAVRVWKEGGVTAQVLCVLHVMDYACFDKLEIPSFCQNVYNDDEFVKAILEWDGSMTDSVINDDL